MSDKVPHKRLILKLEAYGICGNLLEWIRDFLSKRRQRVVLGEHVSEWEEITSGVTQGSLLGPILFFVYINDLPEALNHFACNLYADDSKIIAKIDTEFNSIKLQQYIDGIVR